MEPSELSKYFSEMGRKGGKARLKRMTSEERREIAVQGGRKSGEVRSAKAKAKRARKARKGKS